ncbi:MAG: SpoIIE family protein phosphatase [Phycisphaerae bacterium]|nr:SpoIIE family protein phosphatase [Phycisphaerae bacterium]
MNASAVQLDTPLHLDPISGPEIAPITLRDPSNILGRGGKSNVVLAHDAVSREHVSITRHAGAWYVTDLASRNGTRLGNLPLPAGQPTPLQDGDTLELKPWSFIVRLTDALSRIAAKTIDDLAPSGTRLRTTEAKADSRIRQQFDSLLRASALLYSAKDEAELLEYLLQTTLGATGFERAAVIRRTDSIDSVEVVAQRFSTEKAGHKPAPFHFSRSLLRAAAEGPYAVVGDAGAITPRPDTMIRHDIAAAACAPIRLSEAVWGYLYLDSGLGTPPTATGDLLELVRSLTDITSLALSNVKQQDVRKRLTALQSDFEAAAEIQQFLLPAPSGSVSRLKYAVRSRPGRIVSGDIFDVLELPDNRVALFLGDVMGKGIAAGLLMASVQSFLHAILRQTQNPSEVLEILNAFVAKRCGLGRFVSLWLGILDATTGVLTISDAGHGYCIVIEPDGTANHLQCAGGTPLGATDDGSYLSTTLSLVPGRRILIYSDGVVEQPSQRGEPFGQARLLDLVGGDSAPDEIVDHIVSAVLGHASASIPADDLTAAAVYLRE